MENQQKLPFPIPQIMCICDVTLDKNHGYIRGYPRLKRTMDHIHIAPTDSYGPYLIA